jgi:lipopolysaccharide transport system permease protein
MSILSNRTEVQAVSPLVTVEYSSESALKAPFRLTQEILTDLWRSRGLAWILFHRDLMAQYRQSYLGYLWIFAPVLTTVITWTFLTSQNIVQTFDTDIPYPAYVFFGTVIWTAFSSALTQPLASFTAGSAVFMKLKVAPEAFILAGFGKLAFDLLIRLLMLVLVCVLFKVSPATTAPLVLVGVLLAMFLGGAIGVLMIPVGSLYGDVSRIVGMVVAFGMYLTPVVYPVPSAGWSRTLFEWNPMTTVVLASRDWLSHGIGTHGSAAILIAAASAFLFFVGIILLRVVLPHLVERMGM